VPGWNGQASDGNNVQQVYVTALGRGLKVCTHGSGAVPVAMMVLSHQVCHTGTYEKIFLEGKGQFPTFHIPHSICRVSFLQKAPVTRQIPLLWTGLCSEAIDKVAIICHRGDKAQVK
jgi:hypothetical protein